VVVRIVTGRIKTVRPMRRGYDCGSDLRTFRQSPGFVSRLGVNHLLSRVSGATLRFFFLFSQNYFA
jgi:hypothetical protein